MVTVPRWLRVAGVVLHVLVGGLMIFAGSGKAFGFAPPEIVDSLSKHGLGGHVKLIGFGELIAAVLLLVPRMTSLGTLVTSGFWGGVICYHLANGEPIAMGSAMLVVTWVGAVLREPRTLASLAPSRG